MPVYRISLTCEVYVLAEDPDAAQEALRHPLVTMADGDEEATVEAVREVRFIDEVPPDWHRSLPYGDKTELTLETLLPLRPRHRVVHRARKPY